MSVELQAAINILLHVGPFIICGIICYEYVNYAEQQQKVSEYDKNKLYDWYNSEVRRAESLNVLYGELREALVHYHDINPDIMVQKYRLEKLELEEKNRKKETNED
jgi:hypothetical protein